MILAQRLPMRPTKVFAYQPQNVTQMEAFLTEFALPDSEFVALFSEISVYLQSKEY